MTFMDFYDKLTECVAMLHDPDKYSRADFVEYFHKVLENIPEWRDKSLIDPMDPLMVIYENYDSIMLDELNKSKQFFTISATKRNGETVRVTLPTLVADMGMKKFLHDIVSVELTDPEPPSPPPKLPPKVTLGFKKLDPEAKLPCYAHVGDAGMDVFALEDSYLDYGTPRIVRTGLAAEIPEGYELQVRARSGLALKGVQVVNGPGTIDSKYRGEIGIILMFINHAANEVTDIHGSTIAIGRAPVHGYEIKKGDKIAQLVLAPVTTVNVIEVAELSETDRGTGGFGSTGR